MGDFEDLHAQALAFAHHRKVSELGDLTPELVILRDGVPAAVLHHGEIGELLGAAITAARAYGADALALVFEGVLPLVAKNPLTGAEWESGEADEVWRNHDGVAQGWVTECQLVSMVTREMRAAVTARPFVLGESGVTWSETQKIGGVGVEQALARALAQPVIDVTRIPDPGEHLLAPDDTPFLTPEQGRVAIDVGATRSLDSQLVGASTGGGAVLFVADEDAARRYDGEGLMAWQRLVLPTLGPA